MRLLVFLLVTTGMGFCLLSGCITATDTYTRLPPGLWRGVLSLDEFRIPVNDKDTVVLLTEQFKEGELPFQFEVHYTDAEKFYVVIHNGQERIRCDSIQYGRDRSMARDTMNLFFPEYQSYIHADIRGGVLQGEWIVTTKKDYRIPFYAHAGRNYRFSPLNKQPAGDLTGTWATIFGVETDNPEKAIGEFHQDGNRLTGTFRTETGDYRFLEGTIQGNKFWLSAFDGAHAFLFSGSLRGDSIQGEFRSGTQFRTLFSSWRDPAFQLKSPDSITTHTNAPFSILLTDENGNRVRYPKPDMAGKVQIYSIAGTWCPNCKDELLFLRDFFRENPRLLPKTDVIVCAFERGNDTTRIRQQLKKYRDYLHLPFAMCYAGKADKNEAGKVFPMLNQVSAFPTMVVVDSKGLVRKVHTGFDGPATSHFAGFRKEFTTLMNSLYPND